MRNHGQDCHSDIRETEVLAAKSWKQQIATHQHSSKETGAWLLCYGLLVYSCLRTEVSTWSSMPIRQPWLLQLLTTGSLPAASSCSSGQLFSTPCRCQGVGVCILAILQEVQPFSNPTWNRCVPLRGKSSQHLVTTAGLSKSSVVWREQREGTFGDKYEGSAAQTLYCLSNDTSESGDIQLSHSVLHFIRLQLCI